MQLEQKVALITGGAVRIGRAISNHLASLGARVIINYNNSESEALELAEIIEQNGGHALPIKADVSKGDEVEAMFRTAMNKFGRIDILINNAGVFFRTDFLTLKESEWDLFMDTNLKGAFLCTQAAAAIMVDKGGGKIINIADVGGVKPWGGYVPYCVSKAGLIMLTRASAKSLAPTVTVNAVAPGPVMLPEDFDAEMKKAAVSKTLLKREGSAEDIARAVQFLIENDYMTGETIFVDGGGQLT